MGDNQNNPKPKLRRPLTRITPTCFSDQPEKESVGAGARLARPRSMCSNTASVAMETRAGTGPRLAVADDDGVSCRGAETSRIRIFIRVLMFSLSWLLMQAKIVLFIQTPSRYVNCRTRIK